MLRPEALPSGFMELIAILEWWVYVTCEKYSGGGRDRSPMPGVQGVREVSGVGRVSEAGLMSA